MAGQGVLSPLCSTLSDQPTPSIQIVPVLKAMAEQGVLLLVHGEVTDAEVDMFDREAVFIQKKLVRGCVGSVILSESWSAHLVHRGRAWYRGCAWYRGHARYSSLTAEYSGYREQTVAFRRKNIVVVAGRENDVHTHDVHTHDVHTHPHPFINKGRIYLCRKGCSETPLHTPLKG